MSLAGLACVCAIRCARHTRTAGQRLSGTNVGFGSSTKRTTSFKRDSAHQNLTVQIEGMFACSYACPCGRGAKGALLWLGRVRCTCTSHYACMAGVVAQGRGLLVCAHVCAHACLCALQMVLQRARVCTAWKLAMYEPRTQLCGV